MGLLKVTSSPLLQFALSKEIYRIALLGERNIQQALFDQAGHEFSTTLRTFVLQDPSTPDAQWLLKNDSDYREPLGSPGDTDNFLKSLQNVASIIEKWLKSLKMKMKRSNS